METLILQIIATILAIIISVFTLKKFFEADIKEKITKLEKVIEQDISQITIINDSKFVQMNESTKMYLESILKMLDTSLSTYKELMSQSIKMSSHNIENCKQELKADINRRFENVCYIDTCEAKHDGINKSVEDNFKALNKRFDDVVNFLEMSKRKNE